MRLARRALRWAWRLLLLALLALLALQLWYLGWVVFWRF